MQQTQTLPTGCSPRRLNKKEIALLLKKARFVLRHPACDIRSAPKSGDLARILIITPRAMGNAVKRNLVRRRIKSLFYEKKWYSGDHDWLIYAKKPITQLSFKQLQELISTAIAPISDVPAA